jgi:hypothetical protein
MIFQSCSEVRSLIQGFHDRELSIQDQIAVQSHLVDCAVCAAEVQRLAQIGDALRQNAATFSSGRTSGAGFRAGVISRLKAERNESLAAQVGRMFEDLHLVWAGLGATAATLACVAAMLGLLHYASPERADSLAGVLAVMSSPGSNDNPVALDGRMLVPRVDPAAIMPAMLVRSAPTDQDVVFALAGVVTREGRLVDLSIVGARDSDRASIATLINSVSDARFEPARYAGSPVAVNLVWLLAHTTVRAKQHRISQVERPTGPSV